MTIKLAETITGLTIDREGSSYSWYAKNEDGLAIFYVEARNQRLAAERVVAKNWDLVSEVVMKRDGYKCVHCGGMQNLSVHHKVFRSHGRRDVPENLETNCLSCHEAAHCVRSR
jgi:5-methylcytosine-specific restriction endonuclease McrA